MAFGDPIRLDRPVDDATDHILGPSDAEITLVEYGSYACQFCRAANARITRLRDEFGDRMRYVFRHRPVPGSDLARRAAELVESARTPEDFWRAHLTLMTRSEVLTAEDVDAVEAQLHRGGPPTAAERDATHARIASDEASAHASGVRITPTFFINGRRYEGVWEESGFADAMLGSLGHRVIAAALDFARWAPAAGILLVFATFLALLITNTALGSAFLAFWEQPLALSIGHRTFQLSLLQWVNDGLLSIFFLVVGLEIKREFTIGHLSSRRSAALPLAAALGGMVGPILAYLAVIPGGDWTHGWGVPMATDTAFAVALIVMLGRRVPIELRVFLTAATIIDDIGAILVVAFFYSSKLSLAYLAFAGALTFGLWLLNRMSVYRLAPYLVIGIGLWFAVHEAGLHATLAGVILALFIPTRPAPNLNALMNQADAILSAEARHQSEILRTGPSTHALRALDAIHDRLESPADRLLRRVSVRSNYVVLPVFAFANAGVLISMDVVNGHEPLMLAIITGLVLGKPIGIIGFSWLAVATGLATKPAEYSWRQLLGAGALSGIGFTMSLFIAGQAFTDAESFAAAKIAVFGASFVAALVGVAILWRPRRGAEITNGA